MKTNKLTKLVTALSLFMLFACENQEILQLEETQTKELNIDLGSFEIDELPDLANEINNLTKSSKMDWTSKSTEDDVVLDESRILAVTDSLGNTTFSIRMYVPKTPYNVFHNMVLKKTAGGKMNEPFILRYEVKEDYWPTYILSERKDAPFQGDIDVYSISSIDELNSKTGKSGASNQPCYSYSSTNGSNGSSGSSPSGGSGNSSQGNWGNTGTQGGFSPVGIVWSNTDSRSGSVEVGEIKLRAATSDPDWVKKSYSAKNEECPEDEMLIPINEEEDKIDDTKLVEKEKCVNVDEPVKVNRVRRMKVSIAN